MSEKQLKKIINRLDLLKLMYLSREGDRREGVLLRQSKGWFQVAGMGHETLAIFSLLMEPDDYLFPYYRDRAMALGRGLTNYELALAYFAKLKSSSGGRQMPGHYSDRSKNVWSVPTPTGASLLPACGAAWGMQMDGRSDIVVATTGDAASRQGECYEAIAFAIERELPVIFIIEDNNYGISTNTEKFNPFKLGVFNDDFVVHVDAREPAILAPVARDAISKARAGAGPTVIVAALDRLCSHTSSDDHRVYREPQEISEMMDRDPINEMAQELISEGVMTQDGWEQIQAEIDKQVDDDYRRAEKEADPKPEHLTMNFMADLPVATKPPIPGDRRVRIVDAVNSVFKAALKRDNRHVFFGEDIEDPKGGVFGLTLGLSDEYPDRVFNSPLAEATIAGVACGLASYGKRPIFEFQFIDFTGPAWNQLSQNLSNLRWRTNGDWTCPVVFYAPCGAYLPGGSVWHSQTNESTFAHIPGVHVVCPSTPEDAAGLMWTALDSKDPLFFFIPKHLIRQQMHIEGDVQAVPIGKARLRREGTDVTLITWGNCVEQSLIAAEKVAATAAVEVIDLRSLKPWDREAVVASLAKTGRLVVVQEDSEICSVGQMVISDLTSHESSWYSFLSPPQLVSRPDVQIGYNPVYEYAALPSVERVVAAIQMVMEQ
jgi:2-oxoisovalerate dehydrogenase E1 component